MRTVPLVLCVELARLHRGDNLLSRLVARVVQRPGEITELLAYYARANGRGGTKILNRVSKQLQKGLALSFNRFDGYQLAKYNRDGAVRLRDALFLVRPTAQDAAQRTLFDQLVRGESPTPYTWETELSALGQQVFATFAERIAAVARIWETLIGSGRLGYMTLLRNLRNILEADVSAGAMTQVCATLAKRAAVAHQGGADGNRRAQALGRARHRTHRWRADEAPMAYKDIHTVMASQRELVDVLGSFTPKIVRMDGA